MGVSPVWISRWEFHLQGFPDGSFTCKDFQVGVSPVRISRCKDQGILMMRVHLCGSRGPKGREGQIGPPAWRLLVVTYFFHKIYPRCILDIAKRSLLPFWCKTGATPGEKVWCKFWCRKQDCIMNQYLESARFHDLSYFASDALVLRLVLPSPTLAAIFLFKLAATLDCATIGATIYWYKHIVWYN